MCSVCPLGCVASGFLHSGRVKSQGWVLCWRQERDQQLRGRVAGIVTHHLGSHTYGRQLSYYSKTSTSRTWPSSALVFGHTTAHKGHPRPQHPHSTSADCSDRLQTQAHRHRSEPPAHTSKVHHGLTVLPREIERAAVCFILVAGRCSDWCQENLTKFSPSRSCADRVLRS
jgi:hypothetical protein